MLYTKKTIVWCKIETTSGTDVTPTADNGVLAYDVSLELKPNMLERGPGHADRSLYPQVRGKTTVELKFTTHVQGSGTAGTPPRFSPLLEACDRQEVDGAASDDYIMASTHETATIWVNIDGILHKLVGCAGDCEVDLTAGEVGKYNWTFQGVYALPTDSVIVASSFDDVTPPTVKATSLTLGGYSVIAEKINIKFGNKVVERASMNATEGVLAFIVGDRAPTGTMLVEAALRAAESQDWINYFSAGTTRALSVQVGATAGNITIFRAPVCVFGAPKWIDKDGVRQMELDFQLARSSGNDELNIEIK